MRQIVARTGSDEIGLDPVPEMVMHPRTNPYIFFDDEIFEDDDE